MHRQAACLGGGKAQVCQAHGGGQREGDSEPGQATHNESPHPLQYRPEQQL